MEQNSNVASHAEALNKIGELIKDIRIAILTTAATDGSLHSRPMATQQGDFHGELWFLTKDDSGKVTEIRNDAHVSLTYADQKHTFVCLAGRASVSRNRAKIDELWNPIYKAWFPQGKDDPEIAALQVHVESAEYWEAPSSAIVRNFRILLSAATKGSIKVGEHDSVKLD